MHNIAKIDCNEMNNLINNIQVFSLDNQDVKVENVTNLHMIGKGRHGAVFEINPNVCVKVYADEDVCAREFYALSLGQNTTLLPKVYCNGKLFIVMEMIKGIDLREYLQSQPLTKSLSANLIKLLSTFKEIGYERIDHHKRHIFVQEDGSLKVLDVGTTVWRNRVYPYPRKLLNSLGEDYKALFLEHVKEIDPHLYEEWQTYMKYERFASLLHQEYFKNENINLQSAKESSHSLLTNPSEFEAKIEDIVRKVHKEEWIKALVAKGLNPEEIKERTGALEDEFFSKDNTPAEARLFQSETKKQKEKGKAVQKEEQPTIIRIYSTRNTKNRKSW